LFDQHYLSNRPHLVALGDSHVAVIAEAARRPELRWPVSTCLVGGATAQGLHNPNSRTDALGQFRRRCDNARAWQYLVFMLGEIDCGFVIWYRAEKYGVSVESQVEHSLGGYRELLGRQIQRGFRTLVLSVPLPTIQDGQDWGEVANARREVKASLRDRTDLTLEYNRRLATECAEIGAIFIDFTADMLDPESRQIRSEFMNPDPTDHHLNVEVFGELVARRLLSVVSRLEGPDGRRPREMVRS
jgi:hypothetical protein